MHPLDIFEDIANKLKVPASVHDIVHDDIRRGNRIQDWAQLSAVEGLPALACFYSVVDHLLSNRGWDRVAHEYLSLAINKFEQSGNQNVSLFTGLSGLCFATHLCSKNGTRYQGLLGKLDSILVDSVETILAKVPQNYTSSTYVSPQFYNLVQGMSGTLAYLLMRKDHPQLQSLAKKCTIEIVNALKEKRDVGSAKVPGWYVSPTDQIVESERENYPNGNFILSLPYGVTGCLLSLSLAAWNGTIVPSLLETISEMAQWLREKQLKGSQRPTWPHTHSLEAEIHAQETTHSLYRDAWAYGTPMVALSLFYAGRVLNNKSLKEFAEERFCAVFSKPDIDWNLIGPCFGYGRAGLLSITYQMMRLTESAFLKEKVAYLSKDLIRFYDPGHPFGFQVVELMPNGENQWMNDPGLINGASGIALALLLADGRTDEIEWERLFLLR